MRSPWAIKKINSYGLARKELVENRLKYEAQILKQLKHPNLVEIRHTYHDGTIALEAAERSLTDEVEAFVEQNEFIESIMFTPDIMMKMIKGNHFYN